MQENRKEKIRVSSFTKYFGDLLVLDNLDFSVYEKEFLCIVGPTGCGKTTFVNLVAGLISPTKGTITIDRSLVDPKQHNISLVFQEPSCLPWRTVWDNIRLGLEIKGVEKEEINTRVREMVDLVALKGFEHYYPGQISAGMKQRVAVARAFVARPDLLLMDEPFGALDSKTRFYIEDQLIRLWGKLKQTVVFVTHNLEEAVYLAQRIIVLTQKPTHIKSEVHVDLDRPREYSDPQFVKIRREITELVKWW